MAFSWVCISWSRLVERAPVLVLPLLRGCIAGHLMAARRLVPVGDRPPGVEVVEPPVLVLQVIGVFPDVIDQHRELALRERILVAAGGGHLQLAAVPLRAYEPHPAGAKYPVAGFCEAGLELREAAEVALDRVGQCACRLAAAAGRHRAPEQAVVQMPAGVVAH